MDERVGRGDRPSSKRSAHPRPQERRRKGVSLSAGSYERVHFMNQRNESVNEGLAEITVLAVTKTRCAMRGASARYGVPGGLDGNVKGDGWRGS